MDCVKIAMLLPHTREFLFWERGCHVDARVKLCNGGLESPALWFTSALFYVPEAISTSWIVATDVESRARAVPRLMHGASWPSAGLDDGHDAHAGEAEAIAVLGADGRLL